MGDRIEWTCDQCERPVHDRDGLLHVSFGDLHALRSARAAWDVAHPGPIRTSEDLRGWPRGLIWQVHHGKCDPDPHGDDYWIEVHRVRSPIDLLVWTSHLFDKGWFSLTEWPALLKRATRSMGVDLKP